MNENGDFYADRMPSDTAYEDMILSGLRGELIPIISERDGGIIGYAIGEENALRFVNALRYREMMLGDA